MMETSLPRSMNGMTMEDADQNFRARFLRLQDTEHAKNALIEELLLKLDQLSSEYQTIIMDRDREVFFNRDSQQQRLKLEAENRRLRGTMERNPFVLVLLDGDGMIFQDYLLQKGEQGGRDAAGMLWTEVRNYIEREMPSLSSSDCRIVARIYANVKGLAETCFKAGIVDSTTKIEDFARGFTRSKHLFDFIDVGSGKDRADDKLSEVFKLHLSDCHCRRILFGCSHDNGYARLLEDYTTDPTSVSRIILLEGYPFEREIGSMRRHFPFTKFENVFRGVKITVPTMLPPQVPPQLQQSVSPQFKAPSPVQHHHMQPLQQPQLQAMQRSVTLPTSTPMAPPGTSVSTNPIPQSWALAATTVASPPATPQPYSASMATTVIPRNRKGQRIDPEFKYDRYDIKRVKTLKMCNIHYLRGDCAFGDDCTHDHSYKPTASELASVRYIARQAPCRMGTDCDDPKCIYGHRCPAGTPCTFGDNCRFPDDMHFTDTVVVKSIKI